MRKQGEGGGHSLKRWLEGHDGVWLIALFLTIFALYGLAIYFSAHSNDFLLQSNVPFESAVW